MLFKRVNGKSQLNATRDGTTLCLIDVVRNKLCSFRLRQTALWKDIQRFGSWLETDAVRVANEVHQSIIAVELGPDGVAETLRIGSEKHTHELGAYQRLWDFLHSLGIRCVELDARLERNQVEDVMALLYSHRRRLNKYHADKIARGIAGPLLSEDGIHIACTRTSIQGQTLIISYSYCTLRFSRILQWFEQRHKNFHDHRALFHAAPRYALLIGAVVIIPIIIYAYILSNWYILMISGFGILVFVSLIYLFFMIAGSVEYDNEEKAYRLSKTYYELKNYTEECERLSRALTSKNKELQRFTSVVRHDIGNSTLSIPCFGVILAKNCQLLKQMLEGPNVPHEVKEQVLSLLDGTIAESVGYINKSASDINNLLEGLRHLVQVGRIELEISPLDMNEIVNQTIGKMKALIEDSGVTVKAESLPGCMGDAGQVVQVFENLLSNAIKYLDPNRAGSIHVCGRVEEETTIYSVEDNGVGIAPERQEKIFEIFHRVDPDGPVRGEGLGLTIAKDILDRHNGKIWLDSVPNKGSTFYVALPTA